MSEDEVYQKRDILLARMDANLIHVVEWSKNHTIDDKEYQRKTDDVLDDLKKFKWRQIGAIGGVLAVLEIALKLVIK